MQDDDNGQKEQEFASVWYQDKPGCHAVSSEIVHAMQKTMQHTVTGDV